MFIPNYIWPHAYGWSDCSSKAQLMKMTLRTYIGEDIVEDETVEVNDNYDGDPYGDTVPFTVHSNQVLIPKVFIRGTNENN